MDDFETLHGANGASSPGEHAWSESTARKKNKRKRFRPEEPQWIFISIYLAFYPEGFEASTNRPKCFVYSHPERKGNPEYRYNCGGLM
jgi:hypothetical protein